MLYENINAPAFCPILFIVALAIKDNTFKAAIIQKPSDIHVYALKVPKHRGLLKLNWKDSMLDIPIFRVVERNVLGNQISLIKAFPYATLQDHMLSLGLYAGFEHCLVPYCLRRAAA